jgi:sugar lactone lactonase YvrE
MADAVTRTKFITPSDENFLSSPNGVVAAPDSTWFVSSIINGVIVQFDRDGTFMRKVLEPPAGETLGPKPFSTGTPLGLAIARDGTLFYADLGLVVNDQGIGPGRQTGSVRRIRFVDGEPQAPETIAKSLTFPDGLGVFSPPDGG